MKMLYLINPSTNIALENLMIANAFLPMLVCDVSTTVKIQNEAFLSMCNYCSYGIIQVFYNITFTFLQ